LEEAGIRCQVRVSTEVSGGAAETLGWLVREAVTNVLRHSDASTCSIEVAADATDVLLSVHDDGRGAVPTSTGHGLANMTSRVAERGGSLQVTPTASNGFTLVARLPSSVTTQ
jgi:two-component system sensor histidine kinase DesK